MYDRILVPTDGTAGSDRAIDHALGLARIFDGEVHALYVVDARPVAAGVPAELVREVASDAEAAGRKATEAVVERARDRDLAAVREVREGVPHRVVLDYADESGAELVVMGRRDAAADVTLGSTADRVVRAADVPVLVVPAGAPDAHGYDAVLVPTDGSDPAERAADAAIGLADRCGSRLHFLYVVDETVWQYDDVPRSVRGPLRVAGEGWTADLVERAEEAGVEASRTVATGVPYDEIRVRAADVGADLVVMGARGLTGEPPVLLGSTTARVLRTADLPVMAHR